MQDDAKGFYNYCAHEAQRFIVNKLSFISSPRDEKPYPEQIPSQ